MKRPGRIVRAAVSVVMTGAVLAGCGGQDGDGRGRNDMNMQEAAERADAILDATLGAVAPEVQWAHDTWTSGSCTVTRRRTVTTVISEQRRGSFLGVIERFWKKSGYEITGVNQDREMPSIFARSTDGFLFDLTIGYKGQAFFDLTTPCVEKSDVADPTTKPNGPAYPYGKIPTPNVHSDFWSATTPATTPAPAPSS
ncbi:hypothetical protein [Streptomyces roseolus]|uniref:hypothetical protein n=1 Tax=Streptomyces roseolus TaxID=67358 RepID=UPI0019B75CAD|nr:hypothetical protein [Streptomyces roseolus]GGR32302.1 hypothetical protein GCM10010282_25910 [Streptomyces roseolus]